MPAARLFGGNQFCLQASQNFTIKILSTVSFKKQGGK